MGFLSSKDFMLNNRSLWGVSIAASVRSIGYGATWPFMAVYFDEYLHVNLVIVGIIFTLNAALSIVFSLASGYISDAMGRKRTLLAGTAIGFVLYILLAIFIHASIFIISFLFVMTALSGSMVYPAANSIVSDATSGDTRKMGYTIYRIMANLGWAIGPLVSAFIFSYGFSFVFLFVAIANIFSFAISYFFIKINVKYKVSRNSFMVKDMNLILFSIPVLLIMIVASQFSVTLPLYVTKVLGIMVRNLGYFYAVNGTVVVIGQYPISKLMARYPQIYSMIYGSIFYVLGYFLVTFSSSLWKLMGDMVVITIGENLTSPSISTIVSTMAPGNMTGRYMGFIGMMNQVGRTAGPSIGTAIMYILIVKPDLIWPVIDVFGISAALLFYLFKHNFSLKRSATPVPR
ncbi:MAG: MDR family MFS transporter [Thermoplasmata archaeon]